MNADVTVKSSSTGLSRGSHDFVPAVGEVFPLLPAQLALVVDQRLNYRNEISSFIQ